MKGLCFRCGQEFGPAHKYLKGKLHLLLLGNDEFIFEEVNNCYLELIIEPLAQELDYISSRLCAAMEFIGESLCCK